MTNAATSRIAEELERCRCWLEVPVADVEARARITCIYKELSAFETAEIRSGLALYLSRHEYPNPGAFEADAKVFAFLRVLFMIPVQPVDVNKGYERIGNPIVNGTFDLLWPYSFNEAGELVLSGRFSGKFTGPPYDALGDFDKLEEDFGRR